MASASPEGQTNHNGVVAASVLTTVSSVFPAFLAGALGDELRVDLGLSDRWFGLVVGAFFFGAMLGSMIMGRLAERIGARRTIVLLLLSIAGIANAGTQTSANKLLSQSIRPERLGFAMAIKQSGMPGGSLLGGLAVPVIALTLGWRWGYVAEVVLVALALGCVLRFAPEEPPTSRSGRPRPTTDHATLVRAGVGAGFAAAAAGTLGNWLTSSATDAGWSSGWAGMLLSFGSLVGIASRLRLGRNADRPGGVPPVLLAARFLLLGAVGAVLLAPRIAELHVLAALLAFGAGWAWPALFNFGIVRANAGAAAAATGVTQTGVYVGVCSGPIIMGLLVERWGYGVAWMFVAVCMATGGAVMSSVASAFTGEASVASS